MTQEAGGQRAAAPPARTPQRRGSRSGAPRRRASARVRDCRARPRPLPGAQPSAQQGPEPGTWKAFARRAPGRRGWGARKGARTGAQMQQLNEYELAREERIRKNREELQRLTSGLQLTPAVRTRRADGAASAAAADAGCHCAQVAAYRAAPPPTAGYAADARWVWEPARRGG
jgi:hypothetical protein